MLAEIGQGLVLFLAEMIAVLGAGAPDRLEPGGTADRLGGGIGDRPADLVVIPDRVARLLAARVGAPTQVRIEHLLLGIGVGLEPRRERLPYSLEVGRLAHVVERGEAAPEPLVVVEDEGGDVGHGLED